MDFNISEDEIREQVLSFMRDHGSYPRDQRDTYLKIDGELHRYSVDGDRRGEKSGAYRLHGDNRPAGFIQNWKIGFKETWKFYTENLPKETFDYFQSEEFKKKAKADEKKREQEDAVRQAQAAEKARIQFEGAIDFLPGTEVTHTYLQKKGITWHSSRLRNVNDPEKSEQVSQILVPLTDINGKLVNFQTIDEEGIKRFFPGAATKGAFFSIDLHKVKSNDEHNILLIGEGFATVAKIYELTGLPVIACMSCWNIEQVAELCKKKIPNLRIIIMADNDKKTELKRGENPGIVHAENAVKQKFALDYFAPEFDNPEDGSDWDDYALIHGDKETAKVLREGIALKLQSKERQKIITQSEFIDAEELRNKTFSPLVWAVDGFLPAGLSVLAGGPKVGKSILSLHLSLAVAIGGCAFGKIDVIQGDVLYIALEDTQRRLQERIEGSNLPNNLDLSRLTLATRIPRQHEGGMEFIRWWLETHKEARLVIIDTLQRFRKQLSGKNSMYSEDYDVVSDIKKVADEFNVPFLLVHHLKKAMADDWLNEISGSQGIAGAADTIFSLKRARTENGGILHRTGRDVEEKDFAMELDGFGWVLKGDAAEFTMPDWKKQIVNFLKEHNSVSPMELSQALNIPLNTAKSSLRRLEKEGTITKIGYGTYSLTDYQLGK